MAAAHRIYARALFDAAREKNRLDIVREELEDIVRALDDVDELDALLDNPEIESHVKAGVLDKVLGGADDLVRNFVRLVIEKGRAGEIREIAADFESLVAEDQRILDVELTTAHELSDADFDRIRSDIQEKSGRKVQATRAVDPDLIGGIVLQAGSMRLDASVRGRLERLRQQLATARS
ncbi:MAG TPA: ATP synthase F1 subunit delta [Gaiellaceae bacterium]